mmetsp:Transcript_11844/g.25073  ORF Transcript_11844/g.25073 Transcript_11844/m.25073 type:complete len:94 (+) Transcript_11844:1265-1546(+)
MFKVNVDKKLRHRKEMPSNEFWEAFGGVFKIIMLMLCSIQRNGYHKNCSTRNCFAVMKITTCRKTFLLPSTTIKLFKKIFLYYRYIRSLEFVL